MNYTVKIVNFLNVNEELSSYYQFDNQESAMIFANTALMSAVDNIKVSILINKNKNIKEEN
jgi:hypothetical protein